MPRKATKIDRPAAPKLDQATRLLEEAPDGPTWLHEIKLDG